MKRLSRTTLSRLLAMALLLLYCGLSMADAPTVTFYGSGQKTVSPGFANVTLDDPYLQAAKEGRLLLIDRTPNQKAFRRRAQFESTDKNSGRLWWIIPSMGRDAIKREFQILISPRVPSEIMSFKKSEKERYTLTERKKPALTYNFGAMPVPEGVTGIYAVERSDYVHPIYGPNGEELTYDYSPDHPHHRGIYWAWPEVTWKGETRDIHALQGVFARPVKIKRIEEGPIFSLIEVENVWMWGDTEPIVRETVLIRVFCTQDEKRVIDFEFQFEAISGEVGLARRRQIQYGGFNVRLSKRDEQKITMFADPEDKMPRRSWGEVSGVVPTSGAKIGFTILEKNTNLGYPGEWVEYPDLPWLQPTFPTKGTVHKLLPGKPLNLAYRIVVHPGESQEKELEQMWNNYRNTNGNGLYHHLSAWTAADARAPLLSLERQFLASNAKEQLAAEAHLLALVSDADATNDIRRWVCQQLAIVGSRGSVPSLALLLKNETLFEMAVYALTAIPGDEASKALREALPTLPTTQQVVIIAALAGKRDSDSVTELKSLLSSKDTKLANAALCALGAIGSEECAEILANLKQSPATVSARLLCAENLATDEKAKAAGKIYISVWEGNASSQHRGMALKGLANIDRYQALKFAVAGLDDKEVVIRQASAATLNEMECSLISPYLAKALPNLPVDAQVMALHILRAKGRHAATQQVQSMLGHKQDSVRLAVLEALETIGDEEQIRQLVKIATEKNAAGQQAVKTLSVLPGRTTGAVLQKMALEDDGAMLPVLTQIIATRKDANCAKTLLTLANSQDPDVATIALSTLRRMANETHLSAVTDIFLKGNIKTRKAAGRVIVAICATVPDRKACVLPVVEAIQAAPDSTRGEMLFLLPKLGGKQALTAVNKNLDSRNSALKQSALRTLTQWPDEAALPALMGLLKETDDTTENVLLVRSLVRLIPVSSGTDTQKVEQLMAALQTCRRDEERTQVANALAAMRSVEAVKSMAQALDKSMYKTLLAQSITIAAMPGKTGAGLTGCDIQQALKAALSHLNDEALAQKVSAYLVGIQNTNLAQGKPVTASGPWQANQRPELAVDGNTALQSYWSNPVPDGWLQVDLRQEFMIDRLQLFTYWDGKRYYQYRIEISLNGEKWETVVDGSKNTTPSTPDGVLLPITKKRGRYVRIHMLKNSSNPGQHVVELRVFEAGEKSQKESK